VLLVEVSGSDITWPEPRDLSLDEIGGNRNSLSSARISAKHRIPGMYFLNPTTGGIYIVRADGIRLFLRDDQLAPKLLAKTLSVGGCSEDGYDNCNSNGVNWTNCGIMLVFVASTTLLLSRAARRKP